jgi:CheY-like chemotaxis protein
MEQSNNRLKILILEDSCERIKIMSETFINDNMVVTNCAETAIEFLNNIKFDLIMLDHDLGGDVYVNINDENTGSEVCRKINKLNKDSIVVIHSWNKVGGTNMALLLKDKEFSNINKSFFNEGLLLTIKGRLA